jgi:hypothetical protein
LEEKGEVMKKFSKTPPTKKISVPIFAVLKDEELPKIHTIEISGKERIPLILHRAFNNVTEAKPIRGMWQITHLFTGFNLGVYGSYRFCREVANELLDEPILYLPSEKMMINHPDYKGLRDRLRSMEARYWMLGGMHSSKKL